MLPMSKPRMVAVLALMLMTTTVYGHTGQHGSRHAADSRRKGVAVEEKGCEDGWLFTHRHCLLVTDMSEDQAQVFCVEQGAQEARGICVKKPAALETSREGDNDEDDDKSDERGTQEPSSMSNHECPLGWVQYGHFCFFRPGSVPEICELLGAKYVLNFCYTRIPHHVTIDFLQAVKRLEGSDYDLHRDTRLCCCRGGGLCK